MCKNSAVGHNHRKIIWWEPRVHPSSGKAFRNSWNSCHRSGCREGSDVNETKAISSGGKAIETGNKGAAKVGKEIVEEIAKGNLVADYVYVAFGNLNTDFELRISDLQCMIKREMQKRILTPRNSSLTFCYFPFFGNTEKDFQTLFWQKRSGIIGS